MKAQGLNLIRQLAGLAPTTFLVRSPQRRRLWGGDNPKGWVGTDFRFFGGHNYGYMSPPISKKMKQGGVREGAMEETFERLRAAGITDPDIETRIMWEQATYQGFGVCAALLGGVAQATHGFTWLKFLATCVAYQEGESFILSKYVESTPPERLVDPRHGSLVEEVARGETRLMFGSSQVAGFLAGFCLQRTGFLVFNGFWHKHWVAFYGGNALLASYVSMYLTEAGGGALGIAHEFHFAGLLGGYLFGWLLPRFYR